MQGFSKVDYILQAHQETDGDRVISLPETLVIEGAISQAVTRGTCHVDNLPMHQFVFCFFQSNFVHWHRADKVSV